MNKFQTNELQNGANERIKDIIRNHEALKEEFENHVQGRNQAQNNIKDCKDVQSHAQKIDWECPISVNDTSYRLIDGACFYFESIKMTYAFAENNCLDKFGPSGRGRLLEPQSLRQNMKIYKVADQEVLGTGSNLPYWIGVTDIVNEGTYSYNSQPGNTSVTLEAWAPNEPSGSTTDNCIAMDDFPGKWWDRGCNTDYASICEVGSKGSNQDDVSSQDASSNDSPKSLGLTSDWSCPVSENESYKIIDGSCIYFEAYKMNYAFAEANCLDRFGPSMKGRLVEPQTLNSVVKLYTAADQEVLGTGSGRDYWIGVSDRRSEGNYSYNSDIDDVSVDLGTWRNNEPSGVGQECVVMDNYPGHWYDRTCKTEYASICEIDGINQIEDTETVIDVDQNPSSIEDWDCPVSTNDTSYRLIDGACYFFESVKMNYAFAENNCFSSS